METLASNALPANADNTGQVESTEADANVEKTNADGSAPSVPEADTPATKVKDPVQERFDKLTRDKYDALREADRRGYELERLNARLAELEKAPKTEIAPQNTRPTLEQFGYDEGKFNEALDAYHEAKSASSAGAAREAALEVLRAEREATKQQEATRNWAKKEAEFIKSKPDYVEKVIEARTLPISREIQMELRESELGPQIAYHLVENPEKAAAIMALPLKEQLKEIGRIEERLGATKTPAIPAVSNAPPPVGKVDSDEAVVTVKVDAAESDSLSDKEWTRRRNAQEQARIRKARGG